MEDEAIIAALTQVKGIGRWTVQMLLIFRLRRWDVLPVDDLGVRSGIRQLYDLETLPDKKSNTIATFPSRPGWSAWVKAAWICVIG